MSTTFKRVMQNLAVIFLIIIGVVSMYYEHYWSDFLAPMWSMIFVAFSGVFGLYLVFRRELSAEGAKRPHILAILACICWAAGAISVLTLMIDPSFYGYDLEILFNSMNAILGWSALGLVFTIIELFWSLRSKIII
jgi:hypothetical protein